MAPAIFGAYIGHAKPADFDDFLGDFFKEFKKLNGTLRIDNRSFKLHRSISWILDMPALADTCGVKNSGYNGCTKCDTEGVINKPNPSVHFPELGTLRTNESFRDRVNPRHHKRESILEKNEVDMVNDVHIDPMHSVDLGIGVLIVNQFAKAKFPGLGKERLTEVENVMANARLYQPAEFGRKFQSLARNAFWKSSEYRNFLLFILPVIAVFLKVSPRAQEHYSLLINLFVGLRLLAYKSFEVLSSY